MTQIVELYLFKGWLDLLFTVLMFQTLKNLRSIHLPQMTCQTREVAIPMDRKEIRCAVRALRRAVPEKVLEPCEPVRTSSHRWRAGLDA